jgi:hypothetical protein
MPTLESSARRQSSRRGSTLSRPGELAGRIGHPVYVVNDANMGARGEQRFGAARGCRHFNRYAQPAAAQAVSIRVAELGLRAELVGAIATALARVA